MQKINKKHKETAEHVMESVSELAVQTPVLYIFIFGELYPISKHFFFSSISDLFMKMDLKKS